jgi:predicted MPP superfamily phosphohydrolase
MPSASFTRRESIVHEMSLKLLLAGALGAVSARVALDPRRDTSRLVEESFIIDDLPPCFDGYTIAALADLHYRPYRGSDVLRHTVDMVLSAVPDLVVFLGDFGASLRRAPALSRRWYRNAFADMEPELRRLSAPDGILGVLGNHDYYGADVSEIAEWFRRIGGRMLLNEAAEIVRGPHTLRVAGTDDLEEGTPDPYAGCRAADDVPTIILSHNPDVVLRLARDFRVDLVLAGHTHGGQIVLPIYGAPLTMSAVCGARTASGWVPNPRAPLYVTRGLGAQLPLPIRFNCPPELLLLRLRAGAQQRR